MIETDVGVWADLSTASPEEVAAAAALALRRALGLLSYAEALASELDGPVRSPTLDLTLRYVRPLLAEFGGG
jgi:hypothetical protein